MGVRKWPNRSLCSSRSTPLSSLESLFPSSMSSLQFTLPTTCSLHLPLFLLPSLLFVAVLGSFSFNLVYPFSMKIHSSFKEGLFRQNDARFGDFPTDQRAGSAKGER
ncbi:hypothetical protein S83_046759 [Arachis hypogaea]